MVKIKKQKDQMARHQNNVVLKQRKQEEAERQND
jgi:hypothetical protein